MSEKIFTELHRKFYFVAGEKNGQFPFSNGLMLETGLRVLVDTGFGPSRREAVKAAGEVDVIINTHFHLDHAFGNQCFGASDGPLSFDGFHGDRSCLLYRDGTLPRNLRSQRQALTNGR